jgi:hypothetical protein
MSTSTYNGFLVGLTPGLTRLTTPKDLTQCWTGTSAKLEIKNESTINLSFSWNGHQYTTTKCVLTKPDNFQLTVNSSGGWEDKAFLKIYRNEKGIVIKGAWKSTTESEVWGEFIKIENVS